MLPNDPFMLYSVINTKLRDEYPSLAELCKSEDVDINEITEKLEAAGLTYDPATNQFR